MSKIVVPLLNQEYKYGLGLKLLLWKRLDILFVSSECAHQNMASFSLTNHLAQRLDLVTENLLNLANIVEVTGIAKSMMENSVIQQR